MHRCRIFVGSSHQELGKLVCKKLGVDPAPCTLKKFSNGETTVQIEVSVRDEDVYIIQSGSHNVNDHIMELLILISACKGGSASKITAVIPHFPYSKQSKMKKHRGAITARMIANLIILAGADHVISMDLHASQMQGFFTKPVDNLHGLFSLACWIRENISEWNNAVVVSKNPGGTKRVTRLADTLGICFAMIHTDSRNLTSGNGCCKKKKKKSKKDLTDLIFKSKVKEFGSNEEREDDKAKTFNDDDEISKNDSDILICESSDNDEIINENEKFTTLVGNVEGKVAIILDDMIDKLDSFISAAKNLRKNSGAKSVYVIATHGIFLNDSLKTLYDCPFIDKIVVTNTHPIFPEYIEKYKKKLVVIDVSQIFAECIRRDHFGESISVLFDSLAV